MKAVLLTENGLKYKKAHKAAFIKRASLVEVNAVGLCSSDIKKIAEPKKYASNLPIILGHEVAGTDGSNKRVVLLPFIGFEKCRRATFAGLPSIGKELPGGFQEKVWVPACNCIGLPSNVTDLEATMIDPVAVVIHGINRLNRLQNAKIALVGDGALSLIASQLLGADNEVTVFGKHDYNLQVAETYGAKAERYRAIGRNLEKFDVSMEMVGSGDSLETCCSLTKRAGTVLVYGVFPMERIGMNLRPAFYKELTTVGSNSYGLFEGANEFFEALELLRQKKADVGRIITHVLGFAEIGKAMELLASKDANKVIKIVMRW